MKKPSLRMVAAYVLIVWLAGCITINDTLTPSLHVFEDDFDGATIVRQKPVSATGSPGEGWHTLGFEWSTKTPDLVFITVGVQGIKNVTAVAFNADGTLIHDRIEPASAITEYGEWSSRRFDWSTRRFAMSWEDFQTVAQAHDVKMRVTGINDYTVSSFGPAHPNAIVNAKVAPFIEQVSALRR